MKKVLSLTLLLLIGCAGTAQYSLNNDWVSDIAYRENDYKACVVRDRMPASSVNALSADFHAILSWSKYDQAAFDEGVRQSEEDINAHTEEQLLEWCNYAKTQELPVVVTALRQARTDTVNWINIENNRRAKMWQDINQSLSSLGNTAMEGGTQALESTRRTTTTTNQTGFTGLVTLPTNNSNEYPRLYPAESCVGTIVSGVCHGTISNPGVYQSYCAGTFVNGSCVGTVIFEND
jgi:hypothetical protein